MDKSKYKDIYNSNKRRKLFKTLAYMFVISFILGVFFVAVLSKNDKLLIKNTFDIFFKSINDNKFDAIGSLTNNLLTNVLLTFIVWLLGISIIGIPIGILYLSFKSFVLGFSISSLFYTYGFKVIPVLIIYIFPLCINLFIIFILTFYAINFSKKLYLNLFKKKDINLGRLTKIYSKFLLIMLIILTISSLFSSFLVPMLINAFTKGLI